MIAAATIDPNAPRHPSSGPPCCGVCHARGDLVQFDFTPTIRVTLCPSCRADLHRLTAPTAPVLTVGAALAMPEVQRGECVTESVLLCGFRQYRIDGSLRTRIRSIDDGATWGPWRPTWVSMSEVALPCRLVPVDLADRDPSERGAL